MFDKCLPLFKFFLSIDTMIQPPYLPSGWKTYFCVDAVGTASRPSSAAALLWNDLDCRLTSLQLCPFPGQCNQRSKGDSSQLQRSAQFQSSQKLGWGFLSDHSTAWPPHLPAPASFLPKCWPPISHSHILISEYTLWANISVTPLKSDLQDLPFPLWKCLSKAWECSVCFSVIDYV